MFAKVLLIQGNLWDILAQASLFVWIILIILAVMSLGSWAIIINKWRRFRKIAEENQRFLTAFRRRGQLKELVAAIHSYKLTPLARVFEEGYREMEALRELKGKTSYPSKLEPDEMDTVDKILEKEANFQISSLERNVSFLATTGNVAPFLGLLGTCWGIMYAFWSIGQQGSASLVVVAPGIAEALVATIIGLAAAIPAVIGFNWCNTKLKFIADDLHNFSLEFLAALTKENSR